MKEKFKADHVASVLAGNITSAIKLNRHHTLEEFGSGREKDEKFWNAVFRQAMVARFIDKDIENYGLLKVTKLGHDFLNDPVSFMLTLDHDYDEEEDSAEAKMVGSSSGDPELLGMLKDLRKHLAKKLNLPPFVIFQDPSLEEMATQYPITMEELTQISGVGAGKAAKFGKEFIALIQKHVDENEIERPQDMVVKSVVNKSGLKVFIIQSIDRKMPLEDIAEAKGLEMPELIDEIESIVNSGTKLNINYYIDEMIDEDKAEDIYLYFKEEAETESVQDALEVLGEDEYSEEAVRLIRIKFISDLGN